MSSSSRRLCSNEPGHTARDQSRTAQPSWFIAVAGDHYELVGMIVLLGLRVNAIPCAAAEAVYSFRSASFNLFQSWGKITTWATVTQGLLPF